MIASDYILDFLAKKDVKHVFLITGGAICFLVDAFARTKKIQYVYTAHEQAAAMMAESYARHKGMGVAFATSGPGATNLLTGIACAWFDSIPTMFITGQVNPEEQSGTSGVRQTGFQETDIVSMARPITKRAVRITKVEDIPYELDRAYETAVTGRPGPVILDIPMNMQKEEIPKIKHFVNFKIKATRPYNHSAQDDRFKKIKELIEEAERPLLLVGGGVKIAGAKDSVREFAEYLKAPVVSSWSGYDLFERTHPLYVGSFGVYGERAANFAVQNADVILSIGSRLDTRQTSSNPANFAPRAKVIMVDIDQAELNKRRGFTPHITLRMDALDFLTFIEKHKVVCGVPEWIDTTQEWKSKYPIVLDEYYKQRKYINSYVFIKELSKLAPTNAVVIPDDGGHLTWTMQAWEVKRGQTIYSAYGNSPMGYAFPAGLGASFATERPVYVIDGDGSLQINIQEMVTWRHYNLPMKLFVLNNGGYGIIKQFQELYLGGRQEATNPPIPNFRKIARAYGIDYMRLSNHRDLKYLKYTTKHHGPLLCEVMVAPEQKLVPKLEYGGTLEDLSPKLERAEFEENMLW